MPELPDVEVYVQALDQRVKGEVLERVRLGSPFLLRTVDPPVNALEGKRVVGVLRLGKRIVLALEGEYYAAIHLMVAGRLHWKKKEAKLGAKTTLAAFDFSSGTLLFTEAGSKKRASLHLVRGATSLSELHRGGLEPLDATSDAFAQALRRENHTLKRALTDPGILSGIGNSYSDEILHFAKLSPFLRTQDLTDEQMKLLHAATFATLMGWTEHLKDEAGEDFPEKVTAFREGMRVHGKYNQPCPDCSTPIQRIVYAENEANYCPTCQTGGKLLADRALSKLLREDWPKTLEDLERRREQARSSDS